jgi:hypothetical protein
MIDDDAITIEQTSAATVLPPHLAASACRDFDPLINDGRRALEPEIQPRRPFSGAARGSDIGQNRKHPIAEMSFR